MQKDKWIFYTDLFGHQRWERVDAEGVILDECTASFATRDEAVADASRSGLAPGARYAARAPDGRCEPARASCCVQQSDS